MNKIYKGSIEIPLFETTVRIFYCKNDLRRLFNYTNNPNYEEYKHCDAVVARYIEKGYINVMFSNLKLRTILHECFHITAGLLVYRDINLDNPSTEEIYAYFNAWITTEVLNKVKKWGKLT